jgi:hypothetical protein
MAKHEAVYPLILPEAPGCPDPTVDTAINRACWEFCEGSLAWQEPLDEISVKAGTDTYEFDIPSGSVLVVLTRVALNGVGIEPIGVGNPRSFGYSMPTWLEVRLHPAPSNDSILTMTAALKPVLNTTSLPEILTARYADAIAEGAKSYLKRMPGQAWSDPGGATASYQVFKQLTVAARISSEAGRMRGNMSVRPRVFGR